MKITMEFELPDDQDEFEAALNGNEWKIVVESVEQMLRGAIEHGHNYKTANTALEACQDLLWQLMNDWGLSLYD